MPVSAVAFEGKLWRALERSSGFEAEQVRAALQTMLPQIERILSAADTAPTDFTLHDDEHSFRVAEKMVEVVPGTVLEQLTPFELALLILSAYLHDIGMTPDQRTVARHWRALIAAPASLEAPLTSDEQARFQAWLDDSGDDIQIPLCTAAPTEEQLRLADKLVTHYARARHNDWSEAWIRANLADRALGTYEGWVDDLITLCRSHHDGYDELRSSRFDPRPAGAAGVVVHLRYLACVLRVADVLDVDPERTPDVVFAHREIASGSVLYWRKDHATWLSRNGTALVLSARPSRAAIEKAIRDTAAGIEAELQVVARLAREQPFNHCSFAGPLPHAWDWCEAVEVQVQPAGNSYVYIDGAFRPNTQKVLQLLSGTQLYRDPLVAVREVIQNAFDAVKEEIALHRLRAPRSVADQVAQQHRVELRLEQRDGRYWLACTDSGVGMTQAIIRDYLLVSGASRRHELLDLERRCRAAGFALGRTGEFGIGVLSYFMIADRVEIRTRRTHAHGGMSEPTGWYFETDGVGSFGELRRDAACTQGSEVRLRLRRDQVQDPAPWFNRLRKYLDAVLCVVPCEFELTSPIAGCDNMRVSRGWVRTSSGLTVELLSMLQPGGPAALDESNVPLDRLPRADQERLAGERAHYEKVRSEAAETLRWHVKTGELPDGLGSYRVHVPVFELPGGRSAAFMRVNASASPVKLEIMGKGLYFVPRFDPKYSWRGMAIRLANEERGVRLGLREFGWGMAPAHRYFFEIDWVHRKAGEVTVDRRSFAATHDARNAVRWVQSEAAAFETTLFQSDGSQFEAVNFNLSSHLTARTSSPWAVTFEKGKPSEWGKVRLPAISSAVFKYQRVPAGPLRLGRKEVSVVPALREHDDANHYEGLEWPGRYWTPDRLVGLSEWAMVPVPLWDKSRAFDARANRQPRMCRFPPEWSHLCCCLFSRGAVWNASHPVVLTSGDAGRAWWAEVSKNNPDPLHLRDAILQDLGRAAAWTMALVGSGQPAQWQSLCERDPDLIHEVWRRLLTGAGKKRSGRVRELIAVWEPNAPSGRIRVFTPDGYRLVESMAIREDIRSAREAREEYNRLLPKPSAKWVLHPADRAS